MAEEQGKKNSINVTHGPNKAELQLQLDPEKIAAIRGCLEKGELRISISDADIRQGGRFQASYLYD